MKRLINLTLIIFFTLAIKPSARALDSYRHTDSLALVDLYVNAVGNNWFNKSGWLTSYITSWYGITTQTINGHVRVTEIRLPNNNLQNILVLRTNLDQLQVLDVHDNPFASHDDYSIFGNLRYLDGHNTNMGMPANIGAGSLGQLQVLNLENNQITHLYTGNPLNPGPTDLPSSMGNLSNLTFLNLRGNQFSGNISWVSNLTQLTVLDLTSNKLSGTIPSSLWNITSLTYLSLFNNQFTGTLPTAIGNLTNLTLFSLGVNQFSGSIPTQIGSLTKLTFIDFNGNSFSGSIPSQLGNLLDLDLLRLNQNQLSGTIPSQIGNLTKLTTLDIGANQLSGSVPSQLNSLVNLKFLSVCTNQLTGTLPSTFLSNATKLENIFICNNKFTGNVPISCLSSPKLTYAALFGGGFSGLPDIHSLPIFSNANPKVEAQDNFFTFEDIEPNRNIPSAKFTYTPQQVITAAPVTLNGPQPLSLSFIVGGSANSYQWYRNGVAIGGATSSSYSKSVTTVADGGNYLLTALNSLVPTLTISRLVTVTATGFPQTITFNALPTKMVGEVPFQLTAVSTSGLPIVYTSSNLMVATVTGNMVSVMGSGSATIAATQPGNANYSAAAPVPQTLTVNAFAALNGMRLMVSNFVGGAFGKGTIMSMNLDGSQAIVNLNLDGTNGTGSFGGLIQASNGDVYGTTRGGGANNAGTIGKIKPDGTGAVKLFDFGGGVNGVDPYTKLVQATNGDIYGTTVLGGTNNDGVIFRIKRDGTGYTKLFDFGGVNGVNPVTELMQASNGDLYGATETGGINNEGLLYKIKPDGSGFTKLFNFGGINGSLPEAGVIQASNGDLYGTTTNGGANDSGILYKIKLDGSGFTKLFDFGGTSGAYPYTGVIQALNGDLGGTTAYGGTNDAGIAYIIKPDGSGFTKIYNFGGASGINPWGSVTIAPNGDIYGTTVRGGTNSKGVIYKFSSLGAYTKILDLSTASGANPYSGVLLVQVQSGPVPNVYVTSPVDAALGVTVTVSVKAKVVTGATGYTIELNSKPNFTGTSTVLSGATSTLKFSGLSYNTTYYTRVKTNLSSNWGTSTMFTTGTPESFAYVKSPVNASTGQQVNLSVALNPVIWATNYEVELNADSNFGPGTALLQSGAKTSYPYASLQFNTTYYTRVRTNLSSSWGPTKSFTTGSPLQLTSITSPKNNAVNISYTPTIKVNNIGATSYTVELSPVSNFGSGVVSANSTTVNILFTSALPYNTLYYARATSNVTPGMYSPVISFTTGNPQVFSYTTSPKDLAVNVSYVTNVTSFLVPGAATYTIEVNTASNFSGISQMKSGGKSISFTLDEDTQYFTRVYTDLDAGNWGITKSFTTGNALSLAYVTSPKNLAVSVPTTIKVTSNTVPNATSYTIELNTAANFTGTSISLTSPTKSITFTGLENSATYFTRVQTDVVLNQWGPIITSFTTGSSASAARISSGWVDEEEVDMETKEEIDLESPGISIYPVPFRDRFYIYIEAEQELPLQLQFYDMTGREVKSQLAKTNNRIEVETGSWSIGQYILRITTNAGVEVRKLIKE